MKKQMKPQMNKKCNTITIIIIVVFVILLLSLLCHILGFLKMEHYNNFTRNLIDGKACCSTNEIEMCNKNGQSGVCDYINNNGGCLCQDSV